MKGLMEVEMGGEELGAAAAETPAEKAASSWARRHRRVIAVSATTVACALGGALAGAGSFTAGAGSATGPGTPLQQHLATSASQMPSVLGSICGSNQDTATSADTAIACRNFGVASYRAVAARAYRAEQAGSLALGRRLPLVATAQSGGRVAGVASGVSSATKKLTGTAPKLPTAPVSSKKSSSGKKTCVATPSGLPTPTLPPTTLTVPLGSSGTVSVSTGSKGTSACISTGSKKKKHHKKASSTTTTSTSTTTTTTTNPVQSVLNGVSGTVSGVTGGL